MDTKVCIDCGEEKLLSEFSFRNDSKTYRNQCKKCRSDFSKKYRKENKKELDKKENIRHKKFPWKYTLKAILTRCNNKNFWAYKYYGGRGIKCLITEEELKELWFRDKAYEMKKPSIDRKDNDGDYTFENCRYIEQGDNSIKAHSIPILQCDLNGNILQEWESATDASKFFNCNEASIRDALQGRTKTCKGSIWKYKKAENFYDKS